jgi:hypothetical protein
LTDKTKKSQDQHIESQSEDSVIADGGIITGPALFGGAKLAYDIGKDLYFRFKSDKKVFCQLISSSYKDENHFLKIRIASACVHGIYVESIQADKIKPSSLEIFRGNANDPGMLGGKKLFSDSDIVKLPCLLEPSGVLDLILRFPEINNREVSEKNGIEMKFVYCVLDKLGDNEEYKFETRLRWS